MKVLVTHASAHGSTHGIAGRIGRRLATEGHAVTVSSVADVASAGGYDVVVVASAVHDTRWLPGAVEFVRNNASTLRQQSVWLLSVGSIGDVGSCFGPRLTSILRRRMRDAAELGEVRELVRPRGHLRAAGAIEPWHRGRFRRAFLRGIGGTFGDHRDWAGIDAWTDSIVRELRPMCCESGHDRDHDRGLVAAGR